MLPPCGVVAVAVVVLPPCGVVAVAVVVTLPCGVVVVTIGSLSLVSITL